MRVARSFVALISILSILALAPAAFGAAQLAAGATTSARPTSTNPQIRACQITFDPDVIAAATTGGGGATTQPDFHVRSFQLSVKFDAAKVQVNDVLFVPPFVENVAIIGAVPAAATTGTPATLDQVDATNGIISFISGIAPAGAAVPSGDVDIFAVDFTLGSDVSFDTPLTFTIFANPDIGDFIQGVDPATGQTITTQAVDVVPTTITFSFNQMTAIVNAEGTPLPAGALGGAVTLALLGGAYAMRAGRRVGRALAA